MNVLSKWLQVMGVPNANKPEDFITALVNLQKACGVDQLKMSEYGFTQMNLKQLRLMQKKPWGLFLANPCELPHESCVEILRKSYR